MGPSEIICLSVIGYLQCWCISSICYDKLNVKTNLTVRLSIRYFSLIPYAGTKSGVSVHGG